MQVHGNLTVAAPTPTSLKPGELARYGVAFVTPSSVTGQEQDRPALCLIFSQTLTAMRPDTHVVPLSETLSSMNRVGLADDYNRLLATYRGAELLDRTLLTQVSKATGVRYVAQLKMALFQQETQGRLGVFGLRLIETKKANLRLTLQVWNSEDGSIAWEGSQELYMAFETIKEDPISFHEIVEASARDLIAKLP